MGLSDNRRNWLMAPAVDGRTLGRGRIVFEQSSRSCFRLIHWDGTSGLARHHFGIVCRASLELAHGLGISAVAENSRVTGHAACSLHRCSPCDRHCHQGHRTSLRSAGSAPSGTVHRIACRVRRLPMVSSCFAASSSPPWRHVGHCLQHRLAVVGGVCASRRLRISSISISLRMILRSRG